MIERQFVKQKVKEFMISETTKEGLKGAGYSHTKVQRTPLGDKVIIYASRPGMVVGRRGQNIKELTSQLQAKFNLENPHIEISEVENINLDPQIVAQRIANTLEKFGPSRFKAIGHKMMSSIMDGGALGVEILISGKIPSSRAKRWRFYQGYLKKCGDLAIVGVKKAETIANLKSGIVGIKVSIMPPDLRLPDAVELIKEKEEIVEEVKDQPDKVENKSTTKKKTTKKDSKEKKKESAKK